MEFESIKRYDILSELASPVSLSALESTNNKYLRIIIDVELDPNDYRELAEFSKKYIKLSIVIGHYYGPTDSLEFLKYFPTLNGFSIYKYSFTDFEQFKYLAKNLEKLELGEMKSKKLPLRFLKQFKKLRFLSLSGHLTEYTCLGELESLESLLIYKMTLPDTRFLKMLKNLKNITIHHGGTADLSVLSKLSQIEQLDLWRIRGLKDISWLKEMVGLKKLKLGALSKITNLPSLKKLVQLKYVRIDQLKTLESISKLSKVNSLSELHLSEMNQISEESFKSFVGHPSLKALTSGYSSKKKTKLIQALLELPNVSYEPYYFMNEF